jgi:hypothetical protein
MILSSLFVAQTLLSVLLGFLSSVAAAFRGAFFAPRMVLRGGRLWPLFAPVIPLLPQLPTSATGAAQVSPARKGWVPVPTILPSAVGAAPFSRKQGPSFRAERPDLFFRAGLWRVGSRSRGISLLSSYVLFVSFVVSFLVFSSSALSPRALCLCVIFFFLSTFNLQLLTSISQPRSK